MPILLGTVQGTTPETSFTTTVFNLPRAATAFGICMIEGTTGYGVGTLTGRWGMQGSILSPGQCQTVPATSAGNPYTVGIDGPGTIRVYAVA